MQRIADVLGWGSNLGYYFSPILKDLNPENACEQAFVRELRGDRRNEYLTGRLCARKALSQIKIKPQPISTNPNRSPKWPENIVGSITHTRQLCIAIVSLQKDYQALGVDVENVGAVTPEIERYIVTDKEFKQYQNLSFDWKTFLFSAKESIFKCLNPLFGIFPEFKDMEIELVSDHEFVGKNVNKAFIDFRVRGSYYVDQSIVVTNGYILNNFRPIKIEK